MSPIVFDRNESPIFLAIRSLAFWCILLAGTALYAAPQQPQQYQPDTQLIYKMVESVQKDPSDESDETVELKLHVFHPSNHRTTDRKAAVVFFFGGGWNTGTPKQFFQQARVLADRGIVAISAEYRVRSRHGVTPFECVTDGKSAIRWIRKNAHSMGIDPDRIVAAGGSAGGHVAVCTGLIEGFDQEGEDLQVSAKPNAMILFNPVLDTTDKGFGRKQVGKDRQEEISPCHQIRAGIVPTLVFHGTADKTVPFENAERFTKLMKDAGNDCRLFAFEDQGHGFFNSKFFRPKLKDEKLYEQTMQQTVDFLVNLGFVEQEALPSDQNDQQAESNSRRQRPNIIVIYTDDQGYGDASAINPGAKFQTPNMDRLADEGIAFTNGHSADSICTPSRYALLTGRYCWRTRMKRSVLGAEAKCLITDDRMTIASMLKQQGYKTAMVGKWHLGMDFPGTKKDRDWTQPTTDMPLDKGFDYFYGIPASLNYGVLAWFEGRYAAVPPTLYSNKKKNQRHEDYRIMPPYDETPQETKAQLNQLGFEIASDFIDNQCLTRFTDKAIQWIDSNIVSTQAPEPFLLYLPYTSPHFPVCPLPEFHGQGECGAYGEFLIETDYHIGRLMDFLKESGLDDNTLVVFSSDNGPERPWKSHLDEFGHDSRGGFREGKRAVYEGGVRVPFFIRWPAGIDSPGRQWSGPVGQVDLLATFAEIVGAQLPENVAEDSHSFASVLSDPDSKHQRLPLVTHGNHLGTRYAIHEGDWKLVLPNEQKPTPELYHLVNDPAESTNLNQQHPEVVQSLTRKMTEIITNGRTTPGARQANDTGYWKELTWMTEQQFNEAVAK